MSEIKEDVVTISLKNPANKGKIPKSVTFSDALYAEAIFNCTVDGVVGFDKNLRITMWNRNMELHYSFSKEDVRGKFLFNVVPELNHPEIFSDVLNGSNAFLKDSPYIIRKGFFQAYFSPVKNKADEIIGGVVIMHDNTEIKEALGKIKKQNEELIKRNKDLQKQIKIREKAEEELRKAHDTLEERVIQRTFQLSEANRELNEFAYVISHDLKAPLRGISSLSEWISADYGQMLDDAGKHSMELLKGSVKRMDKLIKGILSYYRMSKSAEISVVDTKEVAQEVVKQLRPLDNCVVEIGNLPKIQTEEVPIYQIIQNLVDNAFKYNDKPDCQVKIDCEKLEKEWLFSVADNGKGIPQGEEERVFALFQTGSGNQGEESSGIGLAVVKKIINRLGGRIWVESKPSLGCTFYFTLPRAN